MAAPVFIRCDGCGYFRPSQEIVLTLLGAFPFRYCLACENDRAHHPDEVGRVREACVTDQPDRELLARAFHDMEAGVKAARKLWPGAPDPVLREAVADFLIHVRELRRAGQGAISRARRAKAGSCERGIC